MSILHCTKERMATLSNESTYGASFNKFSLLQEMNGIDADQSLEVLESIDRDVSEDTESEAEPNENLRRAEISKSDLHMALPDNKEISSLKIEELKAELDKRGLKKSSNKGALVQRLRDAIVSEKLGSQIIETDTTYSQIESPANGQAFIQDTPRVDDIYSFIEIKVKEVCRLEVEKLKQEASTSYSNETIASLREENNLLNIRLQELESRYESVREEARTLSDENKSLMTVIRLLNKESQVATKEEGKNIARDADNGSSVNLHNQQGQGQGQGQKKSNSNRVTQQRRATETGKKSEHPKHSKQQTRTTPAGRTAEATSSSTKSDNDRITVVVGDSIIKNLQGRKLGKAVGHRVVVKPFPGATIRDMKSHIIPTIEKSPDQICLHIGTNDLKSKEPNMVADAIVDLAREIENSCDAEIVLSEITTRNDAHGDAVKTVNRRLKQFCRQNGWKLINHANITHNGLNKGGLHLNREGNDSLYRNFVNFLGNN